MEEMFNTDGWKLFINDLQGNVEAIKSALLVQADVEKFYIAKGRFLTITDVLGLQGYLESTKASLETQEDDALAIVWFRL